MESSDAFPWQGAMYEGPDYKPNEAFSRVLDAKADLDRRMWNK
jgi:hypothetical protein